MGYNYKYDVSLPLHEIPIFIDDIRKRLSNHPEAFVCNWGHAVDGNLHLNIVTNGKFEEDSQLKNRIEPYIYSSVVQRSGSISAEHGIGQSKRIYQGSYAKNSEVVALMRRMKLLFDPHGILNPGKVLPDPDF
jgi:FAD/FMN-containing dehydrogenase